MRLKAWVYQAFNLFLFLGECMKELKQAFTISLPIC